MKRLLLAFHGGEVEQYISEYESPCAPWWIPHASLNQNSVDAQLFTDAVRSQYRDDRTRADIFALDCCNDDIRTDVVLRVVYEV